MVVTVEARRHFEGRVGGITTYLRWLTNRHWVGLVSIEGEPSWSSSGPDTPYGYFGMPPGDPWRWRFEL